MKYRINKALDESVVVHTPTEAEAKELLQILHENGYVLYCGWCEDSCYFIRNNRVLCSDSIYCEERGDTILTLEEFKSRYCEVGRLQFKTGDKVKIKYQDTIAKIYSQHSSIGKEYVVVKLPDGSIHDWIISNLEPYTEPTEEVNEDNFIKSLNAESTCDIMNRGANDCIKAINNDMETKELNLVELLKGHEGETFFSQIWGDVTLNTLYPTNNGGNQPLVSIRLSNGNTRNITSDGYLSYGERFGYVVLWPSRALYEQYPLDAYTAWQKWAEEQKKYEIKISIDYCENFMGVVDDFTLIFRTPADRDKAIEEIKSAIGKYSK